MAKLLIIHGPNLNLLGQRENDLYGEGSLEALNQHLTKLASEHSHQAICYQSNAEHHIIDKIHQGIADQVQFIIINPAALTHTSIALRDALLAVKIPFIEVHITNIFARESFRHHSYCADIAQGIICGLGVQGYTAALNAAIHQLSSH